MAGIRSVKGSVVSDNPKLMSSGKPWACIVLVILWSANAVICGRLPSKTPGVFDIALSIILMFILFFGCVLITAHGAARASWVRNQESGFGGNDKVGTWDLLGHDLSFGREWKKAIAVGIIAGVVMTVVSSVFSTSLTYVLEKCGTVPKKQDIVEIFVHASRNTKILLATSVLLMNPVVEEIFFRYTLNSTLVGVTKSIKWSAIITAVCFAFVHANLLAFLPIVFVSLCCTYAFRKTDSILAPIVAHILHNAVSLVALLAFGQ